MRINIILNTYNSGLNFSYNFATFIDLTLNLTTMFKKTFFQIHWFLGITAGLILSIMGVTGAIYSYEQQILKWMNSDSYTVQVQQRDKLTPAELYQHFNRTSPDMKINSITVAYQLDRVRRDFGDLVDVRHPSEVQPPDPGANAPAVDE